MNGSNLYDSLQMAYEFIDQAEQMANGGKYDAAQAALEKARSYAFNNVALLDDIQSRCDELGEARWQYIKHLEGEAADLFNRDRFDGQRARQVLQTLLNQDSQNELAKSLWAELPLKETVERERRLVEEFEQELETIWQRAQELEEIGAGSRAVAEYERALVEASKKAGDIPTAIPLQRLKLAAAEKRDRAKDKWVGTPTLILARKGQELVLRYQTLKQQGAIETEFFDENGEFLGRLPVEECIDRAKKMASRFAEQKAQDYLGQARELLAESPGAAYDKIQDALSLAYPGDFARSLLEEELKEKIQPAMQLRERALAQLKAALSRQDPVEAWMALREAEQMDRFTPGIEDARQRLLPMLGQKFTHLLEAGGRLQELEDFETARIRFQNAIDIGQLVFAYGEEYQGLHAKAQEAFEGCVQAEREVTRFDQRLAEIAQQSQKEPERAKEQLAEMSTETLSSYAKAKIERLRVQIDFRLGVDQLAQTLEQKMLAAKDAVELIPIEEGARQAALDHPEEDRFPRLTDRIIARRLFLKGSRLRENPEQYLEARELLQQVIDHRGDDAPQARTLLDEIVASVQQEADIAIAIQEANNALDEGNARAAYTLLQPYRHAVSHQAGEIRQLISTAATRWRNEINRQLEALVAGGNYSLPRVESLLRELERSQAPNLAEWQLRALAPAYADTARDLQELRRWDQAADLWEAAFRLAPGDPRILEGRRNAQKHQALIRAQMTSDPAEKEQLLNDLNKVYNDDPTVKRYLAEFYYAQDRYAEARLAISQVMFLAEHLSAPTSSTDTEAIRRVEALIREAEKIEKRKFVIRSQITGKTTIGELRSARRAYEELLESAPNQAEKLQTWWEELIKETVHHMKSQVVKLSDTAGTVWVRAELLCKILALQADRSTKEQAERMLRLTYSQLPTDIKMVVNNPEGIGYGLASQSLTNHINKAQDLYKRLVNISQVERIASDLGLVLVTQNLGLNETLFQLELTLENLYFAREKQREIKNQMVVALMTGKWESIEDSIEQLELRGLNQHRGVRTLPLEVKIAQEKRANLERAVEEIKDAMAQEKFKLVQDRLNYMLKEDPADETQLRAGLEVMDPYTGLLIKGHRELGVAVAEKLVVVNRLIRWRAECQRPVRWQRARSKMIELANSGEFLPAIELGRALTAQDDRHQTLLQEETWSLGHLRLYLESPPLTREELNNGRAKALFDQVDEKIQILLDQFAECDLLVEELQRKEKEFTTVIDNIKASLRRLNESKDFLSSILTPSGEIQELKVKTLALVEQGRRLCPAYPAFSNFEESALRRK